MASNGVYGINIPSNVNPSDDVEIYYSYSESRSSSDINDFKPLESSLLTQVKVDNVGKDSNGSDSILEGLYQLKLPLSKFNKKGIYNIYIKPKEYKVDILDVGTLTAYPDVKGIIVDSSSVTDSNMRNKLKTNNELVGYRLIYISSGNDREEYYRIVTSNNRCEPVVQNSTDANQKSVRYRYNESSSLSFITVTPSTGSSFKSNSEPYIGRPSQGMYIVNTKFEPVLIDIEMVENDADTISMLLTGSQLRNLENGLVTTFNDDGEIVLQHEHYSLKNKVTGQPIYEVKLNKKDSIDFSENLKDK